MPAEVIEGVQRDIDAWRALDAGRVNPSFHVHLGQAEARQLVSEAILACERFDEMRYVSPKSWPQLHVLSRVAALLLSAGASEKPPAAVVQEAKDAYDRAPVDVEAASMGGQCCEPYQAPRAERRSLLETDRLRRELREAQGALQAALDARDACEDAWRGSETRFGELLGEVAEAERKLRDAEVRWQAGASRLSGGTPAQERAGERAGARSDAFATAAAMLRRIRSDYEGES